MDPCPFVRIVVGNLALKFAAVAPASSICFYCKIKLKNFPAQFSTVNVLSDDSNQVEDHIQACFNLKKSEFDRILEKNSSSSSNSLKIEVYSGRRGNPVCWFGSGKLVGTVAVPLDLKGGGENGGRGFVVRNGWVGFGDNPSSKKSQLHLNVGVEPDPRFVFEFDGEPECSPQVFQVNGNVRQAVFTCKFGFRNSGERNLRSRLGISETSTSRVSWLSSLRNEKETPAKERKGWSVTIHDLSGSPVAAASMVTPFVPSNGTDGVSRSNPGAWLILRPGYGTWKPWGRLEAWHEQKGGDHLGYRFELLPDAAIGGLDPVTLSSSTINTKKGGKFTIDVSTDATPMTTPSSSFDSGSGSGSEFGSGTWAHLMYQGFVMSSTVAGGGKCSKPEVEVGVQHVSCTEDAAAFVALAAAMDLSMDACRVFSKKLRKELRQDGE